MAKRHHMSRAHSRRHFRKHAARVHSANLPRTVMRGGIRF